MCLWRIFRSVGCLAVGLPLYEVEHMPVSKLIRLVGYQRRNEYAERDGLNPFYRQTTLHLEGWKHVSMCVCAGCAHIFSTRHTFCAAFSIAVDAKFVVINERNLSIIICSSQSLRAMDDLQSFASDPLHIHMFSTRK